MFSVKLTNVRTYQNEKSVGKFFLKFYTYTNALTFRQEKECFTIKIMKTADIKKARG